MKITVKDLRAGTGQGLGPGRLGKRGSTQDDSERCSGEPGGLGQNCPEINPLLLPEVTILEGSQEHSA